MSADSQPRRERAPKSKVRPITEPDDLLREGLPCNVDAERFILGAVLLDGRRFSEIATLPGVPITLRKPRSPLILTASTAAVLSALWAQKAAPICP